jgi:membrane-associated PAP2 superfamily phosphatase
MPSELAIPASAPHPGRYDLAITLVALLLLAAWEFSGLDLAVTRAFATAQGFALKDAFFTSRILHEGGRSLSLLLLALLVLDAIWPLWAGPSPKQRRFWLGVVVASSLAVPALKRWSSTSCPWDLAEFGGRAAYVPHWLLGATDGGPGHCFPSGHAVAAFAFFGVYFLWRAHRPAVARTVLAAVLVLGAAYGVAQLARGAHHASHTMWSAWLCWTLAVLAHRAETRWPALRTAAVGPA